MGMYGRLKIADSDNIILERKSPFIIRDFIIVNSWNMRVDRGCEIYSISGSDLNIILRCVTRLKPFISDYYASEVDAAVIMLATVEKSSPATQYEYEYG